MTSSILRKLQKSQVELVSGPVWTVALAGYLQTLKTIGISTSLIYEDEPWMTAAFQARPSKPR